MMLFYQNLPALCVILFVFLGHADGRTTDSPDAGGSVCKNNDDCKDNQLCSDQKCIDPCQLNVCGEHTVCQVSSHVPLCTCEPGYTGHPFSKCSLVTSEDVASQSSSSDKPKEKKFHIFQTKKNWFQALAYCSSQNMKLATINSQEENDKLVNQIKQANQKNPVNWWIGGSDLDNLGDFRWTSTGTDFAFTKFNDNQPDSFIYPNGEKERCLEIRTGWNHNWNDFICSNHQFFVCEQTA